jgi:hypothetical protein
MKKSIKKIALLTGCLTLLSVGILSQSCTKDGCYSGYDYKGKYDTEAACKSACGSKLGTYQAATKKCCCLK